MPLSIEELLKRNLTSVCMKDEACAVRLNLNMSICCKMSQHMIHGTSGAFQWSQFVALWDAVQQIQLTDTPDQIFWRWTANGTYTTKSAYLAQLKGTFCSFDADAIWHAHAEGKHKFYRFFAWLLVQNKVLTADKLVARKWPCDTVFCVIKRLRPRHICAIALLLAMFGTSSAPGLQVLHRCRQTHKKA